MFQRLVSDLKFRAVAAREISLGVLDVVAMLTRTGRSDLEEVFYEHHSKVVKELPGF